MFLVAVFLQLICVLSMLSPAISQAEIAGPDTYLTAIAKADPGSIIQLEPGQYMQGIPLVGLNGTHDKPIVIEALDPKRPPQFIARSGKNTVSIIDSSYIQLRNIIFDGRDLAVDAIKAEGYSRFAHHITLEGLKIINHGLHQGIIGISTKCPAWGWVIRHNTIVRAGTGMYLGNSNGAAPFFSGVIENNLIYDTLGYNLQIKHQHVRNTKVALPPGPHVTIIRHNVFSKFGNASTERFARPNVLVGHLPPEGPGADDRYAIYGNFFYANATEALFQGEGNIALYSNLFLNPLGNAVHIQPHNDKPKNIWIFHNTIVANGNGVRLLGTSEDYLRLFSGNIIFAKHHLDDGDYEDNLFGYFPQGAETYFVEPLASPGKINLKPKNSQQQVIEKACRLSEVFPDANKDFDGASYQQCNVGAYAKGSKAGGWIPSFTIKQTHSR